MAIKKIFDWLYVERLEILDKDGNYKKDEIPQLSNEDFLKLFELMLKMRLLDQKALNLQRQGRINTYGSLKGQEASQAGLALNLKKVILSFLHLESMEL